VLKPIKYSSWEANQLTEKLIDSLMNNGVDTLLLLSKHSRTSEIIFEIEKKFGRKNKHQGYLPDSWVF